jgi:hypothetical protein
MCRYCGKSTELRHKNALVKIGRALVQHERSMRASYVYKLSPERIYSIIYNRFQCLSRVSKRKLTFDDMVLTRRDITKPFHPDTNATLLSRAEFEKQLCAFKRL